MFSRPSVVLSTMGRGRYSPLGRLPSYRHPTPWSDTSPCPVHAGIHVPGGHCSRRYASYWNAFLFLGMLKAENTLGHAGINFWVGVKVFVINFVSRCITRPYRNQIESQNKDLTHNLCVTKLHRNL